MMSRALITKFVDLDSLFWYLDDMYVLKWAVVGKMIPLMKYSEFSSVFFYLEKKEEVVLILVTVMMSGSPSREVLFLNRWFLYLVKV